MSAVRIDVLTIFPDYLAPVGLSILGRARAAGLLEVEVHDLRSWSSGPHRSVDDSPYGGGPGMVMRPDVWWSALTEVRGEGPVRVVVPTPSGRVFTQADAARFAAGPRMIIACGRYEGIDQRVLDRAAEEMPVEEVSLGDFVLAGGEAAALVLIEATARLIPGVLGNASSAGDDSFGEGTTGLLEGPVYTRPEKWQGRDVPPVLLSGDHGAITRWRREQSRARTVERRPDLLDHGPSEGGARRLPPDRDDVGQ